MTGQRPAAGYPAVPLAALATGVAATSLHRALPLGALLPALATATAGPAVLAALISLGRWRRSLWLAAPAHALLCLFTLAATTLRSDAAAGLLPGPAVLADIAGGLRDGPGRLVATILPAGPEPTLLAAVQVAVWFAVVAAAELAARTASALAPLLPGVLVLACGVLLGATGPGSTLPATGGFLLIAAVLLVVRPPLALASASTSTGVRPAAFRAAPGLSTVGGSPGAPRAGWPSAEGVPPAPSGGRSSWRRVLTGVPAVALVVALAVLVGPRLPGVTGRHPFNLRDHVTVPEVQRSAIDPLDQISAWLADPARILFTVRAPAAANWRIAALDEFDGRAWHSGGRFVPTGARVPAVAGPAHDHPLDQQVTVAALTGVWLPAATAAREVNATAVLVDPDTGVLLRPDGLQPGLRYSVTSAVPDYTAQELQRAVPADDRDARAALALPPGLPPAIVDQARRATAGAHSPVQQATRLARYLRATEHNDLTAPPGHTYGHLAYFLTTSHRGTSEQFATAYAVMARSLGLPTRVVIGFMAGRRGADGTWTVRGGDALAWPEVDFAGLGWVPFYPTPRAGAAPGVAALPAGAGSDRQQIDEALAGAPAAQAPPASPTPAPATGRTRPGGSGPPSRWWSLAAVPPILLLGYGCLALLLPALARRRRRAVPGGARVAAAWADAGTALGALRLRPPPPSDRVDLNALTNTEVAGLAGRRLGTSAASVLARLAVLADAAVFAGRNLGSGPGDEAWRYADEIHRAVRRTVGIRDLIRYRLSPATLRASLRAMAAPAGHDPRSAPPGPVPPVVPGGGRARGGRARGGRARR